MILSGEKKMSMQKFIGTIILVFILSLTHGCTKKETSEAPVVIRYENLENLPELVNLMKDIISEFEKENPDIKIKLEWGVTPTKTLVEFAAGTPPDVFFCTCSPEIYMEKGVLLPLNQYIEKYRVDLGKYFRPAVDFFTKDGKVYSLPLQFKSLALIYNKQIFDEAGIPYPDEDWTWEDYHRVARELTKDFNSDGRRDQFGTQAADCQPLIWIRLNGGRIFDFDKGKCVIKSDRRTLEALEFAVKLKKDASPTAAEFESFGRGKAGIQSFCMGKIAMFTAWNYYLRSVNLVKDFEWGVAPLPRAQDGARRQVFAVGGMSISRGTKHPEEAFRFIKFYCEKKAMLIFGKAMNGLPAHREAAQTFLAGPPPGIKYFADGADQAIYLFQEGNQPIPEGSELSRPFWQQMDLLFLGEVSLERALDRISSEMERTYKENL